MNRNEEYLALLAELDTPLQDLEYVVARAKARAVKTTRVRNLLFQPARGVAIFLIAFIALVNLSTPFAMAAGRVPLLSELAAAVAFSPSLSAAVKNEYVQIADLEQSENGITMRVEYVIVDQKQLNIFYTLHSREYFRMYAVPSIKNVDGSPLNGYSLYSGGQGGSGAGNQAEGQTGNLAGGPTGSQAGEPSVGGNNENRDIRQFVVDFLDEDMPDGLILECKVYGSGSNNEDVPEPIGAASKEEQEQPEPISTFVFTLSFDPGHTQQAEIITLNHSFVLDGQSLNVTTVEIYPTHIRLNLNDDAGNTAWLQSLSFYFENEKGKRFEGVSNGITASGAADSPMMTSHRLESSYFSDSRHLTMYITKVVWLDKDIERTRIDLANGVAENLPADVLLEQAVYKGGSWDLTFSAPEREDGNMYQVFEYTYYDEAGNGYDFGGYSIWSSGYFDESIGQYWEMPGRFIVKLSLEGYPGGTVYLSPVYSRETTLETPIAIAVK